MVVVEVGGERFELDGTRQFTFGRDPSFCDVALGVDPLDQGISRWAGSLDYESGVWWITNRSTTRTLHVVDVETGIGVPLPVALEYWRPARHLLDRERTAILVVGAIKTHALAVTAPAQRPAGPDRRPQFADGLPTHNILPRLTDKQREALVAIVEPYLRPFPMYRPEPRTYEEAGRRLHRPASTVRKRIEDLRSTLAERGVGGLDTPDARRNLSEWVLSNRIVAPPDVAWLESRIAHGHASEE